MELPLTLQYALLHNLTEDMRTSSLLSPVLIPEIDVT
jgi:hypothetical protein